MPVSVTVDPSGSYAYVANFLGNSVSQYTIEPDGTLTPMALPTVAAGDSPRSVIVDPSSSYAYVANFVDNSISQYTIEPDGTLTPIAPATIATVSVPAFIAFVSGTAPLSLSLNMPMWPVITLILMSRNTP